MSSQRRYIYVAMVTFSLLIATMLTPALAQQARKYECLIKPVLEVELSSPVPGVIQSIRVDRGNYVKRGQTLVQLQADAEQAAVDLARAKLEFGQRKVERTEELFRENFTSEYSVDEAITETRLAEVELQQAETIRSQKTLRSPISGIVVERTAQVGEFVAANSILKLADLNPLNIEVVVPVEDWENLQLGMKATVTPQQPVGGEYQAKIVIIDKVIDAASGTFGVLLSMPNPKNKLPAGLRCMVSFADAG